MSFLFPAFLLGALSVAIPIVLHLITRDRVPRVAFSDVRFLARASVLAGQRRRLREWLLLALRVTALLLLTLAFARPWLVSGAAATGVSVVVIDRSLSLSAPGRFAQAQALASEAVSAAPAGAAVAVVAFDEDAEVAQAPTRRRSEARAAIGRLEPTPRATRYAAGIAAAAALFAGRPGRMVVVSDLQQTGWEDVARAVVPDRIEIEVRPVPPVARNLAVTDLAAGADGVVATVLNTGPTSRPTTAVLTADGVEVERRAVTLPAGRSALRWDRTPAGAAVAVAVVDDDGYRWDDIRYVLVGPADPLDLVVVGGDLSTGGGAFYLAQALGADPERRPIRLRVLSSSAVAADPVWATASVTVVVGTDGLDRRARERLASFARDGGGVLVAAGPAVDLRMLADLLGGPGPAGREVEPVTRERRLAVTDARHPVFRPFGSLLPTLGEVRIAGAHRLTPPAAARIVARFDDGEPALVDLAVGAGRALVFASDLDGVWNDFPMRASFVPFAHEAVRYLVGDRAPRRHLVTAEAPPGVAVTPGVTTVPESGRTVVINVDPRESVPEPMTAARFEARLDRVPSDADADPTAPAGADAESEQRLWWYAIVAMAAVLAGEAWVGRTMA